VTRTTIRKSKTVSYGTKVHDKWTGRQGRLTDRRTGMDAAYRLEFARFLMETVGPQVMSEGAHTNPPPRLTLRGGCSNVNRHIRLQTDKQASEGSK
jgi:hypothetical protein